MPLWLKLGIPLALLAAAVAALLLLAPASWKEAAKLAQEGGERRLRELRPSRPGARVLIFAMDGVGEDSFLQVVRSGRAPQLESQLGAERSGGVFAHAYAAPNTLTTFPSTTMAAWATIFTGEPPARTGVPGNEWFERENDRFVAPAPVSVSGSRDTLQMLTEGLVGNAVQAATMFEKLDRRAFVSLAPVYRGADLFTMPEPSVAVDLIVRMATGLENDDAASPEAFATLDTEVTDRALEAIEKHGVPDLQVIYFPGIDLFTHEAEDALEKKKEYLITITDPLVGRVLDAYRDAGAWEDTFVFLVSDHGHTPVLADEAHALAVEGPEDPPAVLQGLGLRVRPFQLELGDGERNYQAVLAYQGAVAYIYLADRSTCPGENDRCDWKRAPRWREDVLPVAQAFYEAAQTGNNAGKLKGAVDLVFTREPRAPGEPQLPFQVFDGERLMPVAEYLSRNARPEFVLLEKRLNELAAGPMGHRAGDILLLAHSGMHLPIEERYYFSHRYRSWHGSPTRQDSRVPLVLAAPSRGGEELRQWMRTVTGEQPFTAHLAALVEKLFEQPPARAK